MTVSVTDNTIGYRPPADPLTEAQVRAAKHKPENYRLSDGHGLYLEVTPRQKSWNVVYTVAARRFTRLLGKWPAMSLKEARLARELLRHDVAAGGNPVVEARAVRQERQESHTHTVERMAREWHERHARHDWSPSYAAQTLQRLEAHAFPLIGAMPIATVRRRDIAKVLMQAEDRSGKHQANNVRKSLHALFEELVMHELLEANPVVGLRKQIKLPLSRRQPAAVTIEEARDVLARFEASSATPMLKLLHRFGALTGLRPSEVRGARWDEIQGATWRVPADRMKGPKGHKRGHSVFLSPQALEVLAVARSVAQPGAVYVFPGHVGRAHQPYGRVTLTRMMTQVLGKGVHVAHGWRAAMTTIMTVRHPHCASLLQVMIAHAVQGQVARLYDRSDEVMYEPQIRPLAHEWAALLLDGAPPARTLIRQQAPDNVVQLREAA